jgi:ABC-type multidrug transport system fused ATPase/permease subunit
MENAKSGKGKDYYFILPRPILEVVAIFMIFMLVYALTRIQQSSSDILITIGVFSFASIKLIPSVTNIMKGIQGLKYHKVVVDLMYNEFKNQEDELNLPKNNLKENKIFNFKKIKFKNVNYNYPNNNNYILKNINLEILKGEKIGIVGESGSGKTTLINLITGLLSPTLGKIELNEDMLINNLGNLQKKIGYVSQSVYLADESLKFNVAFKKIGENINEDRINNLISLLKLNDLIISKKDGLSTTVGEKGIKLSGGQIQRIGIARALYDTPDILILDEATNALDLSTQEKVLKNIYNEMENKTVISISHDVNSLKYCAKIYLLKDCELKNYDKK